MHAIIARLRDESLVTAVSSCSSGLRGSRPPAQAERIKDLASIQGVRSNALIGYGLVVGLDGTGDQTTQTPFTVQSLTTMLSQLGVTLPPGTNLQLKNVAAVMVTATLPAFARPGQHARRHRLLARQRQIAARRHAAPHAAQRRGRAGLRALAGQRARRRRRRIRPAAAASRSTTCSVGPHQRRRARSSAPCRRSLGQRRSPSRSR